MLRRGFLRGQGNDCKPLGPNTQKQMTCQVEGTVETIAIPVVPGPSPAQRKGQAASSHLPLDPVPGPSWLPGWLLALAFTPKGATRKQEMLPDAMPALGAVASPQAEGHNQAAVLTGLTSCGGRDAHGASQFFVAVWEGLLGPRQTDSLRRSFSSPCPCPPVPSAAPHPSSPHVC